MKQALTNVQAATAANLRIALTLDLPPGEALPVWLAKVLSYVDQRGGKTSIMLKGGGR